MDEQDLPLDRFDDDDSDRDVRRVRWIAAGAIALVLVVALVAWLVLRGDGDGGSRGSGEGVVVKVTPDKGIQDDKYALFATLVSEDPKTGAPTVPVWTEQVPTGTDFEVHSVGKGPHVLSLTVSPCLKGDCSTFRGGSSVGIVKVERSSDLRVNVKISCTVTPPPKAAGSGAAPALPLLDCSATEVRQKPQ